MDRDEAAIARTFSDYVQAFHTLRAGAVLPYWHVPCLFISDRGMRIMTTEAEVEGFFTQLIEALKGRAYARSVLTSLSVNQMSERTALISVSRVRYRTDGQVLERLGETYTLRRTDDGWKIAAALVHDHDAAVRSG